MDFVSDGKSCDSENKATTTEQKAKGHKPEGRGMFRHLTTSISNSESLSSGKELQKG